MSVRIVTDSTAYLPRDLVQELKITVVPFHIRIGDQEYLDGVDLDNAEFDRLVYGEGLEAVSSPPTTEELHRVYRKLCQSGAEVISIHIAETLSDTLKNARQAGGAFLGQCRIELIDSKTLSLGLGMLVEAAARAAAEGRPTDEIVRLVRGIVPQIYVVFFSEGLDYLEEGGRIGHAQALLGTMLGIKPFLTLEDGEITPIEKVRTREQAIEKLVEFVSEFDFIKRIAIVKGNDEATPETEQLIERLQATFPGLEVPILSYGPVLSTYVGSDTLGIIVYEDSSI